MAQMTFTANVASAPLALFTSAAQPRLNGKELLTLTSGSEDWIATPPPIGTFPVGHWMLPCRWVWAGTGIGVLASGRYPRSGPTAVDALNAGGPAAVVAPAGAATNAAAPSRPVIAPAAKA